MIRFWGQQEPADDLFQFIRQAKAANYIFENLIEQIAKIFVGK